MANTLDQLDDIITAVPGLNQEALKRQQAASQIMLQNQLAKTPAVPGAANQLASASATMQGQNATNMQQQTNQQVGQAGQSMLQARGAQMGTNLATQETQQQANLAGQQTALNSQLSAEQNQLQRDTQAADQATQAFLSKTAQSRENEIQSLSLKQAEQLATLGNNVKGELLDLRLKFEQDENGRKFSNERQLVDWSIQNAKDETQFQAMMDEVAHQEDMKLQMLEFLYKDISTQLSQQSAEKQARLDYETEKQLLQIQAELDRKIQKEKARAANRNAIITSATTIAGAGVGAFYGGSAGAVVGAQVGAGVGQAVSGATA